MNLVEKSLDEKRSRKKVYYSKKAMKRPTGLLPLAVLSLASRASEQHTVITLGGGGLLSQSERETTHRENTILGPSAAVARVLGARGFRFSAFLAAAEHVPRNGLGDFRDVGSFLLNPLSGRSIRDLRKEYLI
jgi:hypothetical protein